MTARCPRPDCDGNLADDPLDPGVWKCLLCARSFIVSGGFTLAVVPPPLPAMIGALA